MPLVAHATNSARSSVLVSFAAKSNVGFIGQAETPSTCDEGEMVGGGVGVGRGGGDEVGNGGGDKVGHEGEDGVEDEEEDGVGRGVGCGGGCNWGFGGFFAGRKAESTIERDCGAVLRARFLHLEP